MNSEVVPTQVIYGHWQGVERPFLRRARLESVALKDAQNRLQEAIKRVKSAEMLVAAIQEEIDVIDYLTEGGRYRREREPDVANRGLRVLAQRLEQAGLPLEKEKRPRGRPRKYIDTPHKSRRQRFGANETGAEATPQDSSIKEAQLAAGVLAGPTIEGQVTQSVVIERVASDIPKGDIEIDEYLNDPSMIGSYHRKMFIDFHTELRLISRKELGDCVLPYDFSDLNNKEKLPEIVGKVFPCFGLPLVWPMVDDNGVALIDEQSLHSWLYVGIFGKYDAETAKREFRREMSQCQTLENIYKRNWRRLTPAFELEEARIDILTFVKLRIDLCERLRWNVVNGKMTDDEAKSRITYFDYLSLSHLKITYQPHYDEIIANMDWHPGYSRTELRIWANDDLKAERDYKVYEGLPAYLWPEEFRKVVRDAFSYFHFPLSLNAGVYDPQKFNNWLEKYRHENRGTELSTTSSSQSQRFAKVMMIDSIGTSTGVHNFTYTARDEYAEAKSV